MIDEVKVETICGAPMPDRLWLVDMGCGEVSWTAEREPDGEAPLEAVEYVRLAARPAPAEDAVERVARALLAQLMEDQDEGLPSSVARDRGLVWLDGWFDLRAALSAAGA